ncbi:MAG: hypothetical protein ACNA70_09095 [Brevefilum sp.]
MKADYLAIDMGMTHIDLAWADRAGWQRQKLENQYRNPEDQVRQALAVQAMCSRIVQKLV